MAWKTWPYIVRVWIVNFNECCWYVLFSFVCFSARTPQRYFLLSLSDFLLLLSFLTRILIGICREQLISCGCPHSPAAWDSSHITFTHTRPLFSLKSIPPKTWYDMNMMVVKKWIALHLIFYFYSSGIYWIPIEGWTLWWEWQIQRWIQWVPCPHEIHSAKGEASKKLIITACDDGYEEMPREHTQKSSKPNLRKSKEASAKKWPLGYNLVLVRLG